MGEGEAGKQEEETPREEERGWQYFINLYS